MDIATLVSSYRELKHQGDALGEKMNVIKSQLKPLVEADGNWKDNDGYVRLTVPSSSSVSFDKNGVDSLMKAWLQSDDPIMKSCGQMLQGHRTVSAPGQPYLTIK